MDLRRDVEIVAILAAVVGVLAPLSAAAAENVDEELAAGKWGTKATLGVNMLQSYYTRNWNGGDKGSIIWNATLDALAQKQLGTAWSWQNTANLAFGQNHQQDRDQDGDLSWKRPDKTTDQIKAESLLRYLPSVLDPYVAVGLESQFLDQTDPWDRDLAFNPLEIFESIGVSRLLVDRERSTLLARLGFTARQSFRDVYLAAPPDDLTESVTAGDGGAELAFHSTNRLVADRVEYEGRLRFYKPFYYTGKADLEDLGREALVDAGLAEDLVDYFLTIDVDFENTFKANITKVVNVQFHLRWLYDKYDSTVKPIVEDGTIVNPVAIGSAVRKSGQLKQTMSIGLAYTF
ncbi:MAG TPA: DUF3078 domain-containing protein [Candidatus Krumholzibacteria bacterium]|nr:DUF3078 domain-containing protein [Candidatus Krumholzibacteria bacterium]HPD70498.1 DUF3078 domain-containing protein [Candidatus Krumholzibacteria bacterium]HRY39802.1 DUF3078 domain-containing protein [Candidatus Krumholzibacteria bacterium]